MVEQITLSEAMRMLGLHPNDKKRSIVKKHLTQLPPKKFGNSYAIYSKDEVISLTLTHQ